MDRAMKEYEGVLKALDHMARVARDAMAGQSLEDKVRFQKVQRAMENARNAIRPFYYEYEDAARVAAANRADAVIERGGVNVAR